MLILVVLLKVLKGKFLMAKPKSFLKSVSVEVAERAHWCKHNKKHKINKGDKRLTLKEGRKKERFCTICAMESIKRDIDKLLNILNELEGKHCVEE